jgi:hypothetical protein
MPIKFFNDFSLEREIYKLVYNTNNFNNWISNNPDKDQGDFGKQIHLSISGFSGVSDKSMMTQQSLDDYLKNFDVYKDDNIRQKVIKLILKEYNPEHIFKKKNKPFDWTDFKHENIKDGETWTYKDITVIKPLTWRFFSELDENNMPDNIETRRKYNYVDFYGDKKFNTYLKTYGIAFYFVNYGGNGSENDDSKTLLFMVIPHQVNFDLVPRIKYNSVLLKQNSYTDNVYVMGEEKPDKIEVEEFINKYDLDHILVPLPVENHLINRILNFRFKNKS